MRGYPLLLGTLCTVASAYVAEIAVSSAGLDRARPQSRRADPAPADLLWYGGILAPVTIEGHRAPQPLTITGLDPKSMPECAPSHAKYREISFENVRTSMGLVM